MSKTTGQPRFHLLDASALVVGFSLASMLVRAYWPQTNLPSFWEMLFIALAFTWLGVAMSGPVLLLIRRTPRPGPDADDEEGLPEPRSWSELAWLIIGFYWIGLTILVVPARMQGSRFLDSAFLGVFPVAAALIMRFFGPPALRRPSAEGTWTHRAGVILLITWPFVWVALILLGKTL